MASYTYIAATALGRLEALTTTIPEPGDDHVLIKAEYATLTPFDIYVVDRGFYAQHPQGIGGNVGGTVVQVGANVKDLAPGDRVVGLTYFTRNRALQEYSELPRSLVAKIPDALPLEQATTIPDNFVTAFYTLYNRLALPFPTDFPFKESPLNNDRPILIYGAGSTCGQYTIELLRLSGYKSIIAVASNRHDEYLRSLGATHVVDYNSPSFSDEVGAAVGGDGKVDTVVDCIALTEAFAAIGKVIRPGGTLAFLAPLKLGGTIADEKGELLLDIPDEVKKMLPEGVKFISVRTFNFQQDGRLTHTLVPSVLPQLLQNGLIRPNRLRLLDHGTLLDRTKDAVDLFRQNKISGVKLVVKIIDP